MNYKNQKLAFLGLALSLAAWSGCATTAKEPATQSTSAAVGDQRTAAPHAPEINTAAEEANVKKALESFFHAVEVKDWKIIDEVMAKDFEFYGDDTMTLTRDEFISAMKEDNMKIDKLELKDVRVSLSPDGQMAWVKYSAHLESSMRGAPYNMASVETVAFRKEDGSWKMTHNHASVKKLDSKPAKA